MYKLKVTSYMKSLYMRKTNFLPIFYRILTFVNSNEDNNPNDMCIAIGFILTQV